MTIDGGLELTLDDAGEVDAEEAREDSAVRLIIGMSRTILRGTWNIDRLIRKKENKSGVCVFPGTLCGKSSLQGSCTIEIIFRS